jgi:hypothetical protein
MVRVAMPEHMDRSTGYVTRLFGFVDAQLGCCSLGYLQGLCIISVFVHVERQKPVASLSAFKCVFDCMAFVSWSSSRVLSWFFFLLFSLQRVPSTRDCSQIIPTALTNK